jgi:hypothetical protein
MAGPLAAFDAAAIGAADQERINNFIKREFVVHPKPKRSSKDAKDLVKPLELWEILADQFPTLIQKKAQADDGYQAALFTFLAQEPFKIQTRGTSESNLTEQPRRKVLAKVEFNPVTFDRIPNRSEPYYILEDPLGALPMAHALYKETTRHWAKDSKGKLIVRLTSELSEAERQVAKEFVTEGIRQKKSDKTYSQCFGFRGGPKHEPSIAVVVYDENGKIRGAGACAILQSKKALTNKKLMELICIGADRCGPLLQEVLEIHARSMDDVIGIYLNSLNLTADDPDSHVIVLHKVPASAEEHVETLVSDLILPDDPHDKERGTHHENYYVNLHRPPRGEKLADVVTRFMDAWKAVVGLAAVLGGSGGVASTENDRAKSTKAWYRKMGYLDMMVTENRQVLARAADLPENYFIGDDPNSIAWQEKILRPIWPVTKLMQDTVPMFKATPPYLRR